MDFIFARGQRKYLAVRINHVVIRAHYARFEHPVYGVIARAAYAYDLYLGAARYIAYVIVKHFQPPLYDCKKIYLKKEKKEAFSLSFKAMSISENSELNLGLS